MNFSVHLHTYVCLLQVINKTRIYTSTENTYICCNVARGEEKVGYTSNQCDKACETQPKCNFVRTHLKIDDIRYGK